MNMKGRLFSRQEIDKNMKKIKTFRFLLAFLLLFSLFYGLTFVTAGLDWTWARVVIGLATVSGVTIAWSLVNMVSIPRSLREVGFGVPAWRAIGAAVLLSTLMLTFIPSYSSFINVSLSLKSNWPWILVGLICGVGIAEEILFRGYAFNYLRKTCTFWQAATLSMLLFGAMHLLLLLWLPLPLAIAAILLAVLAAYPSAYLFEAGNRTIWPTAILHTTALATTLFEIPADQVVSLSFAWIVVVAIGMLLAFVLGRWILSERGFNRIGESKHA
jgi:membrane protease YdiL (CAAX protease family)